MLQSGGVEKLSVVITGPSESDSHVTDNDDGTCTVEYTPKAPGLYEINIFFGDDQQPVPGDYYHALKECTIFYERNNMLFS